MPTPKKDDLKDRLHRYREITISVIGRKSGQGRTVRMQTTRIWLLLCAVGCLFGFIPAFAQTTPASSPVRDGQHDFDSQIGVWTPHISRLQHPLSGSTTWLKYEGRTVIRTVWNGRANLVELEADGTAGHIEVLCLRLYNPDTHQWSLNYANSKDGTLSPPVVGEFKNGRGEFYGQDQLNGKPIHVRNIISEMTPTSYHFEQAFSDDGGKTWEVNFVETLTRVKDDGTGQ